MSALVVYPGARARGAQRDQQRLRARMEAAVEQLLAALDAMDGDPEAEPWLGDGDDREEEDEHGGDINDVPHDAEPD